VLPVIIVYPSGAERLARSEAVVPPAPTMFSTRIFWPSVRDMWLATMRESVSLGPPAAYGTMIVMARFG
jgi:hypothetical protein